MGEPGEFNVIAIESWQRDHGDEQVWESMDPQEAENDFAGIVENWRHYPAGLYVPYQPPPFDLSKSTRFR